MIKNFLKNCRKLWSALSIVTIVVLIFGSTSPALAQNQIQIKYDEAMKSYKLGDYNKATVAFKGLFIQYPNDDLTDDIQYMLGKCYIQLERYDDAVFSFYAAAYKYPQSNRASDALSLLAGTLYRQDNKEQALSTYEYLVEKYPQSKQAAYAQMSIGQIYNSLGNTTKAKVELQKVVSNYPHSSYAENARESLKKLSRADKDSKDPKDHIQSDRIATPETNTEVVFWNSIIDTENPLLFKAYLEKFPHGVFVLIAQEKLKALNAKSENIERIKLEDEEKKTDNQPKDSTGLSFIFLPNDMYEFYKTPAQVTYFYVVDSLFSQRGISNVGSPKIEAKQVKITFVLNGKKKRLWFTESNRNGNKAVVTVKAPNSHKEDIYQLQEIDGRWAIVDELRGILE